jgi:hypothetical protein
MTNSTFTAPLPMPFYTDQVLYHAIGPGGPWQMQKFDETSFNAEAQWRNDYLFQIAGPISLQTLKVTGDGDGSILRAIAPLTAKKAA